MSHAYTQQQLIAMATTPHLPRLDIQGTRWVWLHEAQVWFQLEGAAEGSCMDAAEMDAHLLDSEPGPTDEGEDADRDADEAR